MTKIEGTTPIYVVWGPTAEWSDGTGPLAYSPTRDGAQLYIEEEERFLHEEEPEIGDRWPYEGAEFTIVETPVAELVPNYWEYGFTDVEDVLDYLDVR